MASRQISKEKRALILAAVCEGVALNSITRMFSVGIHTVLRVVNECAEACEDWHEKHFRNLTVNYLEVDEQWSYIHTHKERMTDEEARLFPHWGDSWLWAAVDSESKALISWRTGKRTALVACRLMRDVSERIEGRVQITTDALNHYPYAIRGAFGNRADHAVKTRNSTLHQKRRTL